MGAGHKNGENEREIEVQWVQNRVPRHQNWYHRDPESGHLIMNLGYVERNFLRFLVNRHIRIGDD